MGTSWRDADTPGRALRPELLDSETQERLPWPAAVLTIGLLSISAWGVLGGALALLFR